MTRNWRKIMNNKKNQQKSPRTLQKEMFFNQMALIMIMALVMAVAGCAIIVREELNVDDQNLKNIAESIAHFQSIYEEESSDRAVEFVDSLKNSLSNIDVISIVDTDNNRYYHSNHDLIDTEYEGTMPDFEAAGADCYVENSIGPSGNQRRAYAAIIAPDGTYEGFVIAVLLRKNLNSQMQDLIVTFLIIMITAIAFEALISERLSSGVRKSLMGYEPDSFSAMFRIRNDILESLSEGIIAVDEESTLRFNNVAAKQMVGKEEIELYSKSILSDTLRSGEREMNIHEKMIGGTPVIVDRTPIVEDGSVVGAVAILHNREEYQKLMEDLAGTRYLVDSMRANNHDFTNKLHVILGLIQMGHFEEAASYIEKITLVRQAIISKIMHAVDEPTIAALLIGKTVKASELNVKFTLQERSSYHYDDCPIPQESLNTIIGNLIENAFDAMNVETDGEKQKELLFGINSKPGMLMISVDDTGIGMKPEVAEHIFENGFSTKGENRGTGMYQSKQLVEGLGGTITVESQEGIGTSFTVTFLQTK